MNSFDNIVQLLMSRIEANPDLSIEATLKLVAKEAGLSDSEIKELEESFLTLDQINTKSIELDTARKEGTTRQGWLKNELSLMNMDKTTNGEEFMDELNKATNEALKSTLTQEI